MSTSSIKILFIGDHHECLRLLREQQFEVTSAGRLADGLAQMKAGHADLVLLALTLPDSQGVETFTKVHEASPHAPIVALAAPEEEELAAGAMRLGAQDYLLMPELTGPTLSKTIRNAIARHLIRKEDQRAGHLLKVLMENIPDSIYFKDTASRFMMINRAMSKRFGLADPRLAAGKSDVDFFTTLHAERALADEQGILKTGQPLVGAEEKETWPDGRVTWVSTTKMPLRDRAGKVFGTFGISRDITEHRRVEESLAERTAELSKERLLLRTLVDNLPDCIYAKDAAGRKTLANPADLRNLRCKTEAEAVGKTDFDLFPKDVAEKFWADDRKVLAGYPVINREEYFLNEKGQKRWLLTSKLPLRGQNGKTIGLVGVGRDITRRKQAEEALARERLLLRTLIDNLPDIIFFKDAESRFTVTNTACTRQLGASRPEEVLGKSDADFASPELAAQHRTDEQALMRSGQPVTQEECTRHNATGMRWSLTTRVPLKDEAGNLAGLIGIARDITPLKQAEELLAEHARELEQKNRQNEEELKMARELQLAMLPHEFPCVPRHKPREESRLEFFSFFSPMGAVSGDFFDIIPLSDTKVGLFICDVMGHDVRAALVTAMMRALVVNLSATTAEPGELLTRINREVAGVFMQTGSTMYATAFYLIADVARAEFCYANAAHPEPLLVRRQRGTVELLGAESKQKKGPALGLFSEGRFPTHRLPMEAGDLIALFTDGLIEAEGRDGETFSSERLLAMVRRHAHLPAKELMAALIDEVKRFSASGFEDDLCIAGVEVKRLGTERP